MPSILRGPFTESDCPAGRSDGCVRPNVQRCSSAEVARRSSKSPGASWFRRAALAAVVLFTLYFAVQGGEYGTTDILRQRSRMSDYRRAIDSLRQAVDSLAALTNALETDRVLQERIAREEFGMIRDGEILYRLVDPLEAGDDRGPTVGNDRQ